MYGGPLVSVVLPISMISAVIFFPLTASPIIADFTYRHLGLERSVIESSLRVAKLAFPLLGAFVFWVVYTGLGVVLAFIPALLLFARYCLTPHTIIVEGEGGYGAIKRGKAIVEGRYQKSLVMMLIPLIAELLLSQAISGLIILFTGVRAIGSGPEYLTFGFLVPLLFDPIRALLSSVFYIDLRTEREGMTKELLEREFMELEED
jgi:hypothetical protein